ncbi:MAG: hypothetical protein ACYTG5_23255, partial [Planctomycetota bacterium]
MEDLDTVLEAARLMATSPGVEMELLHSEEWNRLPDACETLLSAGAAFSEVKEHVFERFSPGILETEVQELASVLTRELTVGYWRFLRPSYW